MAKHHKIIVLVGARPQFIKASAFSHALRKFEEVEEILVHSGQHYDINMSDVFFEELDIPHPRYHLGSGSGSHGAQTAFILKGFESVLTAEDPDAVVVFGDTNTTLAGALAASKLGIPVAHVEAGLRSYNSSMPEEQNRRLTDHLSTWLFCPTDQAIASLGKEGIIHSNEKTDLDYPAVIRTGDIMLDVAKRFQQKGSDDKLILDQPYILFTLHRDFNTDNPTRLENILTAIERIAEEHAVLFPVHPRTAKKMDRHWTNRLKRARVKIVDPLPYGELIKHIQHSKLVITDSGGVQKEAYFFDRPVIIPRPETEWKEMIDVNCAICVDDRTDEIFTAALKWMSEPPTEFPSLYGDGKSAEVMVNAILDTWRD